MTPATQRQKEYQARNLERGMCRYHSSRVATHGTLCEACSERQKAYQAARRMKSGARLLPSKAAWLQVDWTQKFEVIAEQMGVGMSAVSYQYTRYLVRGGASVQSGVGRPRTGLKNGGGQKCAASQPEGAA